MNGKGIMILTDGTKYEGEYLNDKKHGFGTITWGIEFFLTIADSRCYSGNWKNGKYHGEGEYTSSSGLKRKGIWDEGKRVKWI